VTKLEDVVLAAAIAFALVRFMYLRTPRVECLADDTRDAIAQLTAAYPAWARTHPGTCPRAGELGHPNDGWGNGFELRCDWRGLHIHSLGPDGMRDTADDVWSDP
jgi:hypothetical protein